MKKIQIIWLGLFVGGIALFFWKVQKNTEGVSLSEPRVDAMGSSPVVVANDSALSETRSVVPVEDVKKSIPLISSGEPTLVPWISQTPAAKRVCKISPDPTWMNPEPVLEKGDVITLALFDDAVFAAEIKTVTRYPNGAVGMTATLQDGNDGVVFLSYCDQQLRVSVEPLGTAAYYVRYNADTAEHYAIEVDPEKTIVLEGAEPLIPPLNDEAVVLSEVGENLPSVALADMPAGATLVDVMVVYTPAARAVEGGVAGMNNNIAQAMEKGNEAHANSDTQIYLRLVHSAEVSYSESGNGNTDLTRLTNTSDGYMDEVHVLRDTYGADFICLFESAQAFGGLGWLLINSSGRPEYAFCLARVQQSDYTYTVVHEWGHNMGCHHSKTQTTEPGSGLYSYSSGWQWNDTKSYTTLGYCSVMTYENFDSSGSYEYKRVGYFSNPDINYVGNSSNPTGHAANGDNARTLRQLQFIFEGYRAAVLPPSVPQLITQFPYSESFESGMGDWGVDSGDFEWTRQTGATPTSNTGPATAVDGTHYLFADGRTHTDLTAHLVAGFDCSALLAPKIGFSYHMFNGYAPVHQFMGTLKLAVSADSGNTWEEIWSISGNQGDEWHQTNVTIQAYGGQEEVWVRFSGYILNLWSDIAVDLITMNEGVFVFDGDFDEDGLPDEWELLHFGNVTNAVAALDIDGDGFSNREEYIAGSLPANSTSFFKVSSPGPSEEGFVVGWSVTSGRVYSISLATNLWNDFQLLEDGIFWPQAMWTDTVNRTKTFYRVGVELEENYNPPPVEN